MTKRARYQPLKPGSFASQIVNLLRTHGPLKRIHLAAELGLDIKDWALSSALSYLHSRSTKLGRYKPRLIYIKRWEVDDDDGSVRVYPRAVYALGNGTDAKKPAPKTYQERKKAYLLRKETAAATLAARCASVFDMARRQATQAEQRPS